MASATAAASSISVTAAINTSSHSPKSSFDNFSIHFFPCFQKPIHTLKLNKSSIPNTYNTPFSRSSINCASSAFDNEYEDEELETSTDETVSEESEEENDVSESAQAEAGRLYVGNLPFSLTSQQLSDMFSEAGRVTNVEVVYGRVTDRSRGFAFVTMASVDEAKEAIRLFDGAQIGGRTAKVNFPEVPRGGEKEVMSPKIRSSLKGFVDTPYKLYAGNLSWNLTSQALKDVFADQPGFLSAKIIFDRESGRSRGFGFVTFTSQEEVEAALNSMNGMELEGRPIRLNLAERRSVETPSAVENRTGSDLDNSEVLSSVSS